MSVVKSKRTASSFDAMYYIIEIERYLYDLLYSNLYIKWKNKKEENILDDYDFENYKIHKSKMNFIVKKTKDNLCYDFRHFKHKVISANGDKPETKKDYKKRIKNIQKAKDYLDSMILTLNVFINITNSDMKKFASFFKRLIDEKKALNNWKTRTKSDYKEFKKNKKKIKNNDAITI